MGTCLRKVEQMSSNNGSLPAQKRKGRSPKGEEIVNKAEVVKMYLQHRLSMGEIAKHIGCAVSRIHRVIHEFTDLLPDPGRLKAFQESRADFFDAALLESWASYMKACRAQKGTANQFAFGASKWGDLGRLERGQSTSNTSIMALIGAADDVAWPKQPKRNADEREQREEK